MKMLAAAMIWLMVSAARAAAAADEEPWVRVDRNSSSFKLLYRKTPQGDQIMDFSAVGYKLGRHPLPTPPVRITLFPGGGDDSEMLQSAINTLAKMPLDEQGFRGTIKLSKGTFNLGSRSIRIDSSGVVIDGSGPETLIDAHALDANVLFRISGRPPAVDNASSANIIETVPSGSNTLRLERTSGFAEGDQVVITWRWSSRWIQMMNMTEYWKSPGYHYRAERFIKVIHECNSTIELDVPLSFRIDMNFLDEVSGATVERISTTPRISQVGLQNFRAVKDSSNPGTGCFLKMWDAEDAWITGLELRDFSGTFMVNPSEILHATMFIGGTRVTVQDLELHRSVDAPMKGAKPFDVAIHRPGQQILVKNVRSFGNNELSFITGDSISGPNVFFNCTGLGVNRAQPHMNFATGLLYDNVRVPEGGIELINRAGAGHGQGIAAGYSVAWNTQSRVLQVVNPPGGANWALGFDAEVVNPRLGGEPGILVRTLDEEIPSLFLAQRRASSSP